MKTERRSKLDDQIVKTVAECLAQKALAVDPFARSIGIDGAQFRRLMSGAARWNTWHLDVVAEGLGIPPEKLLNPACGQAPAMPILKTDTLEKFAQRHDSTKLSMDHYVAIRLLKDGVSAGLPTEINEEDLEGWALIYNSKEWLPNDPENYTCAHIIGDSMLPILAPGDIVAIDHAERDPEKLKNKMAAFRDNGGVTIKWLRYYPDKHMIVGDPENQAKIETRVILVGDEMNKGIIGKVAWWWSRR